MFTDPDPILTMNILVGDGEWATKPVHHKKQSGEDIFYKADKFFEKSHNGLPCGISKFKELKPPWIWEVTFATCLCPYCFEMRLFQLGYIAVCRKAARPENLCTCAWCEKQKENGRAGIPPPHHAKFLAAKRYCEKKVAPENSGFEGIYPTYSPSCIYKDLSAKRQQHFSSKLDCAAACNECPSFIIFPEPTQPCSFMDASAEEVRYRRYAEAPGTKYKYMEYTTCNRREFATRYLEQYGVWVSHRYHTDWQDAISDRITGSHHNAETSNRLFPCKCIVEDIDFAMAYATKHGKGLKAEHWTSHSIQMHTVVSYHDWDERAKAKLDPKRGHSARRMDVDFFMSDDKHPDSFYVADNQDDLEDIWKDEDVDEIFTISDGGPNHYKCRQHFRNMSKRMAHDYAPNGTRTQAKRRCSEISEHPTCKRVKRHHIIRGENHGKGVGDGFNAIGKGCLTQHERRDENDDSTMVTSHINTASDSVRVGNEKQAKKRAREGSAEGTPKVPKPKHNPKPKPMPNHNPNLNQGCPNHKL
jgi:hypothetical protein